MADPERIPFDVDAYVAGVRTAPCFVCRIAEATEPQAERIVYRDDRHIAFLPNVHVLLGYVLVAPIDHREAVAGDFTTPEYLALQTVVQRVATALPNVVPTERIYVASLGSRQGNAHVHWHVAALPPNVPYEEQQFRALMAETKGVLALSESDRSELAAKLRAAIAG
ncbi:hypothetical protein BH24ACT5_BH24ACT5_05140 [soil metagenome]